MFKQIIKHNKYSLITLVSVAFLLAVWELASFLLGKDYLLPRFSQVVVEFIRFFGEKTFYVNLGSTLLRCLIGFVSAYVLGFILGVLGGKYPAFHAVIRPIVSFLRATPVMALTLLIMVWFKSKNTPIIIGFIMVFPIVYATIKDGINSVDKKIIQVASVYDFSKKEKIRYVYLPEVAPIAFSSLTASFGLNVKAVISAEILSYAPKSIGISMYVAKSDIFEGTAILFAYVLVAVLLSALFELAFTLIKNRVCRHLL